MMAAPCFDLFETMRFDPRDGLIEIERHLARMKASADVLGFRFDRHDVRNELQAATFRLTGASRVRVMLAMSGAIAIQCDPLPVGASVPVSVALVSLPVAPGDPRLRHKTSDRAFYEDARRAAGTFEVLFEDEEGCLTEGSFTSLFVERGAVLLTPPLARGLLPGVLRGKLIDEGRAIERDVRRPDLIGGFFLGNMLRGLIAARIATSAV